MTLILLVSASVAIAQADSPARLVSLSPSVSRILVRLDAIPFVVGVDAESKQIPGLGNIATVGVSRADEIAALEPTVVFVAQSGATASPAEMFGSREILVERFAPRTTDDIFDVYRALATILGSPDTGEALVDRETRLLARMSASVLHERRPAVALVTGRAPIRVMAGDSYASDLVEIAGGNTVLEDVTDARRVLTPDELGARAPDVVIDASRDHWDELARAEALAYWNQFPWVRRVVFLSRVDTGWGNLPAGVRTVQKLLFQ